MHESAVSVAACTINMNPPGDRRDSCRTGRSLPTLTFRATRRIRHAIPADTAAEQSSKSRDPPNPEEWRACCDYLYGIDLFNHGFYSEAHEAWEGLWVACGRSGAAATYLQALNSPLTMWLL